VKVLVFKDIKNNRWTLWSEDRTIHLGYRNTLSLKNCKFIVIESKRKKVVSSHKRFPHAWVVGEISVNKKKQNEISYNPFTMKKFQTKKGKTINSSKLVFFSKAGKCFI
jgi:hypothetical protein